MSADKNLLQKTIDAIVRKTADFDAREKPRPAWLQKQIDGAELMQADWQRGLAMMIDGKQDEVDRLNKVETEKRTWPKFL